MDRALDMRPLETAGGNAEPAAAASLLRVGDGTGWADWFTSIKSLRRAGQWNSTGSGPHPDSPDSATGNPFDSILCSVLRDWSGGLQLSLSS